MELAESPVELLGLEERTTPVTDGGAALVLVRPVASGYCIINTWATWLSSDKRLAILLLMLDLDRAAGGGGDPVCGARNRWSLGVDSPRPAPEHRLIAPSVSLLPKKNQLYLDVKLEYVNRLRLGADGRFVQTGPWR